MTVKNQNSRRGFIKESGSLAAAASLLAGGMRSVHAAEKSEIQVALVGSRGPRDRRNRQRLKRAGRKPQASRHGGCFSLQAEFQLLWSE